MQSLISLTRTALQALRAALFEPTIIRTTCRRTGRKIVGSLG